MGKSGTHFTELNNELRKQQKKVIPLFSHYVLMWLLYTELQALTHVHV